MPDKPLPDVIAPGLDILFCGINPSLMSAARGHHFARPGNRFWPALHLAGLTPRRLSPDEDRELLDHGLGVTNVVDRPTRTAAELSAEELRAGALSLAGLVAEYRPGCSRCSASPRGGSPSSGRERCPDASRSGSAACRPGWRQIRAA